MLWLIDVCLFVCILIAKQTLKEETKNKMHPKEIHMDFEEPMDQEFAAAFSYVTILKDFFHFK
jgi:hypothetical protein